MSLDFKYKRKGIFCFTNVDYENNDKISFDSVNNNSIILKRKLKKNISQNSNILNNDNKNSLEKELNYAKDNYDDKDKKGQEQSGKDLYPQIAVQKRIQDYDHYPPVVGKIPGKHCGSAVLCHYFKSVTAVAFDICL